MLPPKRTSYDSRPKTGREQSRAQAADRLDPAILAIVTALARADARRDHRLSLQDAAKTPETQLSQELAHR